MKELAVIVLNYRRAPLTIGCLESLEGEMAGQDDRIVVLVDNGSDDDSARELEAAIDERGWSSWIHFVASPLNGGFAAGNNIGFAAVEAAHYLLLNSDARARPGSLDGMLESMRARPRAGMLGPRLEYPDGEVQVSCFRYRTPASELIWSAGTGPVSQLLGGFDIPLGTPTEVSEPPWVSFACVMIRREVIEQVGPMDEGYFMYFEDIDYARRVRKAGWTIVHDPSSQVIHLRGGSSSVKQALNDRARVPRYYYESRSRYYAKFYGGAIGLWMTNLLWIAGRGVSLVREVFGSKKAHICAAEAVDNWTNWRRPLRTPELPSGGEL